MGSLESCCKSASSFPKNRFFFTPNICFWAQVQEETCYLNGIILQLGFSPSLLKHFFISKGKKWVSASLLCIFGFWVLVFGLVGSPPLTPLKIKDGRKLSFLCMKNTGPLCSARLSGESLHACTLGRSWPLAVYTEPGTSGCAVQMGPWTPAQHPQRRLAQVLRPGGTPLLQVNEIGQTSVLRNKGIMRLEGHWTERSLKLLVQCRVICKKQACYRVVIAPPSFRWCGGASSVYILWVAGKDLQRM